MPCSFGAWWHFPFAFSLTIAAVLLHEVTHYVGMWPVAESVSMEVEDWTLSTVRVESTIRDVWWRHRWADIVGVVPLAIGLSVVAWWLWTGLPDTDMLGLAQYNAVLWYGFLGGISDYSSQASQQAGRVTTEGKDPLVVFPSEMQGVVARNRRLVDITMLGIGTAAIGMFYDTFCTAGVGHRGWQLANVGLLLIVGAIAVVLARENADDHNDIT